MQEELNNNLVKDVLLLEEKTSDKDDNYIKVKAVADYIKGMSYLKHKTSIERLQSYIESDFDYKMTLSILKDKGIETTYNALRESICYVNKVLKQKLGEDIVSRLKKNDDSIMGKITLLNMDTSKLLLQEVKDSIPDFQYARYDIKDCMFELLFLAKYNTMTFKCIREQLDGKKLAYLYHLLLGNSSSDAQLAMDMVGYLNKVGKATKAEFIEYWSERGYNVNQDNL